MMLLTLTEGNQASASNWAMFFSIIESIGIILTILFAVREIIRSREVTKRDSYERLSREYQALLWQTMQYRHLDGVWEPLTGEQQSRFNSAVETGEQWAVWYSMHPDEKDCYRFTRSALEVLERAWELHELKHIDSDTWGKWSSWISVWSKSSYFWWVLSESKEQLTDGYTEWIDKNIPKPIVKPSDENAG